MRRFIMYFFFECHRVKKEFLLRFNRCRIGLHIQHVSLYLGKQRHSYVTANAVNGNALREIIVIFFKIKLLREILLILLYTPEKDSRTTHRQAPFCPDSFIATLWYHLLPCFLVTAHFNKDATTIKSYGATSCRKPNRFT